VNGQPRFRWVLDWDVAARYGESSREWAHHGIALTTSGDLVVMAADGPNVLLFGPDDRLLSTWKAPVVAGHGLTIAAEHGEDVLWIADNGITAPPGPDGSYASRRKPSGQYGSAVKMTLDGTELLRLTVPPLQEYAAGNFAPTDVAVDERAFGGSGDVWVADGYGRHAVHRYSEAGEYRDTITGEAGEGQFDQPHAVFIDRRSGQPELYVADRGNARIQVFGLDGRFRGGFGGGQLVSPGGFAVSGSLLFVSELDARVTVFDADNEVVGVLGNSGPATRDRAGWPNRLDESKMPVRPHLSPGRFSTPHGIATGVDGSIYVCEWLIGGRLIKLERVDA